MKKITFLWVFILMVMNVGFAQQVSLYSFSESTDTYNSVNGTDVAATGDDGSENGIPIGFTFKFEGVNYTTFSVNTNGFINLGGTIGFGSYMNSLSNSCAFSPLIGPFWDDNNRGTGSIQYAVSGVSPNQILEIGWDNVNIGGSGSTSSSAYASFKIVLHQTTNEIDFIYGSTMDNAGTLSASIGLNGANTFLSVTPGPNVTATVSGGTANNSISSTSSLVGVKYTFTPPSPCTGLPMPGDTVSTVSTVCIGVPFELSLQNNLGSGINYQWKISPTGAANSYVNAPGNSTSNTYTAIQSTVNYYKCIVTCTNSGLTFSSNPVMVGLNDPLTCYCTPVYTTGITYGDMISNIEITNTTLSNNTGTDTSGPSYTHFTGQPNYTATLQAGANYNVIVTVGTFGSQNVAVWIDYNDNGVFDTTERVGYSTSYIGANGTATFPIVLSCSPPLGVHRMRVRDVYSTAGDQIDPCSSYGYGETEDYNVTITAAAPCPQPSGLSVSDISAFSALLSWNTGCTETMWDVHVTLAGGGEPVGAPSGVNVTSPYLVNNLIPETAYDFYVRANCQGNGYSVWTGPFTFTTTAIPPSNDDCINSYPLTVNPDLNCGIVTSGTINAATPSTVNDTTCFGDANDDVWFSFVATQTAHQISLINVVGTTTDLYHSLWTGPDCDNLTLVPNSCSDPNVSVPSGLVVGETYYVRVYSYSSSPEITTFDVCVSTLPPPPSNDECSTPDTLIVGGVFGDNIVTGSNEWATNSNPPTPGCASFNGGDVWYQVVVPASGSLTLETNNDGANGSQILDTGMAVYSGNCNSLFLEACDDDSSSDGLFSFITLNNMNPGDTLYVNVWEYGNDTMGTFKISAYDASLANTSFSNSNFTFYPNPVKDVLTISNSENISKVQVINLLGQEMIVKTVNDNQGQIDMSGLSTGTYLVKITSDKLVKTIKVIKE
ncbi:GEVED domain-containing protein [Flavobacterium sp.]|uniref:GEVED domain-containing protein n=1 Tax=Flavobacterium sp. TaxID=239 RepID=UPI0038D16E61